MVCDQAIEIIAEGNAGTLAVLGDSITDGNGSTTNGQNRWPDLLAQRLVANPSTANVGVANLGIGTNTLLSGNPGFPSGQTRFGRDILNQTGARYLIIYMGVNDIAFSTITTEAAASVRATAIITALTSLGNQAHARGIKPYAATITPFGTISVYTPIRDGIRQTVNAWIRNTRSSTASSTSMPWCAIPRIQKTCFPPIAKTAFTSIPRAIRRW